jgi:hypothetical protein
MVFLPSRRPVEKSIVTKAWHETPTKAVSAGRLHQRSEGAAPSIASTSKASKRLSGRVCPASPSFCQPDPLGKARLPKRRVS